MRRGRKDPLGICSHPCRVPGGRAESQAMLPSVIQALPAPGHGVGVSRVIDLAVVLVWGHDTCGHRGGLCTPAHPGAAVALGPSSGTWSGDPPGSQRDAQGEHAGCWCWSRNNPGCSSGWSMQAPHPEGILKGTFKSWNPRVVWVALKLIQFHTPTMGKGHLPLDQVAPNL